LLGFLSALCIECQHLGPCAAWEYGGAQSLFDSPLLDHILDHAPVGCPPGDDLGQNLVLARLKVDLAGDRPRGPWTIWPDPANALFTALILKDKVEGKVVLALQALEITFIELGKQVRDAVE